MQKEIECTSKYLSNICLHDADDALKAKFAATLAALLEAKFDGHFDAQRPLKGSAFRSIHIVEGVVDRIVEKALRDCDAKLSLHPAQGDLTLFTDPGEVVLKTVAGESTIFNAATRRDEARASSPNGMQKTQKTAANDGVKRVVSLNDLQFIHMGATRAPEFVPRHFARHQTTGSGALSASEIIAV